MPSARKSIISANDWARFDIYWWYAPDGPRLCRLTTRRWEDIRVVGEEHFVIRAHPVDAAVDGPDMELILRCESGTWLVKCDQFEDPAEDYEFLHDDDYDTACWTDAQDDELMVIRGIRP